MSLWNKPVTQASFSDIEDFCKVAWPEGSRLDYKRDVPNDLPACVASFGNTLGGLIVFGIDVDRQTNKPLWPPVGITQPKGFSEQITQICATGIYPPILPNIGSPIPNPSDESTFVAVVRVDQSLEAPHAIQNKTQDCIRTGDTKERIGLADIDRINDMFKRREKSEKRAAAMKEKHVDRICTSMAPVVGKVWLWWRVLPAFVWRPICSSESCRDAGLGTYYGAPNGGFGLHPDGNKAPTEYRAINIEGEFFRARDAQILSLNGGVAVGMKNFIYETLTSLELVQSFYRRQTVEHPGMLIISCGVENVRGYYAHWSEGAYGSIAFPDESMAAETFATYDEFNNADFAGSDYTNIRFDDVTYRLLSQVIHAFSLGALPNPCSLR
jgi:hypothetical protein